MSSRTLAGTAKFGLVALGVAVAMAVAGTSVAQPKGQGNLLPTGPAPQATDPAAANAMIDKGRGLFSDNGCGNCHTLSDAGATGHVGPSLDGDANLTADFIASRVANGQGVMPSFGSQLSQDDIAALSAYIMAVAQK